MSLQDLLFHGRVDQSRAAFKPRSLTIFRGSLLWRTHESSLWTHVAFPQGVQPPSEK